MPAHARVDLFLRHCNEYVSPKQPSLIQVVRGAKVPVLLIRPPAMRATATVQAQPWNAPPHKSIAAVVVCV
jgi:hypothetical protein